MTIVFVVLSFSVYNFPLFSRLAAASAFGTKMKLYQIDTAANIVLHGDFTEVYVFLIMIYCSLNEIFHAIVHLCISSAILVNEFICSVQDLLRNIFHLFCKYLMYCDYLCSDMSIKNF